jgi:hypothetical protein
VVEHDAQARHPLGQHRKVLQVPQLRGHQVEGHPGLRQHPQAVEELRPQHVVGVGPVVHEVADADDDGVGAQLRELLGRGSGLVQGHPGDHAHHEGVVRGDGEHRVGVGAVVGGLHEHRPGDAGTGQQRLQVLGAEAAGDRGDLVGQPGVGDLLRGPEVLVGVDDHRDSSSPRGPTAHVTHDVREPCRRAWHGRVRRRPMT